MQLKIPYSKGKMTIEVPDENFLGVLESHPEGKEQPGTQTEIVDGAPGHDGGRVVFTGTPAQMVADRRTLTGRYLARYVEKGGS